MKKSNTPMILETLEGLKSTDDSVNAIILTAIAAVKQAEESAKKEAVKAEIAAVLKIDTADLAVLSADQVATLVAVPDGQKSAVFSAFKIAAELEAENQALKSPKKAKSVVKAAKKLTLRQAYACLQAYEYLTYSYAEGEIRLSALLAEPLRFLRSNLSRIRTADKVDEYEASFKASYLADDYIGRLADFIGPRFVDDSEAVMAVLSDVVNLAKDGLLRLVP